MNIVVVALVLLIVIATIIVMWRREADGDGAKRQEESAKYVAALTRHLFKDAISVRLASTPTRSHFGGRPPASPKLTWPLRSGRPLSFLACVDCSELPRSQFLDWLPDSGFLLFFYDMIDQVWGFDPKDRGGSATIYLPAADVSDAGVRCDPPSPLPPDGVIPEKPVSFVLFRLPPSADAMEIQNVGLSEDEMNTFMGSRSELYGGTPHHQMGGYPDPVQSADMDLECQLVTNGIYCGHPSGYQDPRVEELREGAKDWALLFQMDSDDALDVMWGDAGMLYYWVRREDARKLDFSRTWLVQQCH